MGELKELRDGILQLPERPQGQKLPRLVHLVHRHQLRAKDVAGSILCRDRADIGTFIAASQAVANVKANILWGDDVVVERGDRVKTTMPASLFIEWRSAHRIFNDGVFVPHGQPPFSVLRFDRLNRVDRGSSGWMFPRIQKYLVSHASLRICLSNPLLKVLVRKLPDVSKLFSHARLGTCSCHGMCMSYTDLRHPPGILLGLGKAAYAINPGLANQGMELGLMVVQMLNQVEAGGSGRMPTFPNEQNEIEPGRLGGVERSETWLRLLGSNQRPAD